MGSSDREGEMETNKDVNGLTKSLTDPFADIRVGAALDLINVGDEGAVESLTLALMNEDEDNSVRAAARVAAKMIEAKKNKKA